MRRVNHRGLHLFGQQAPFLLVARRQKQASCGNLSTLRVETSAFRGERGKVRNRRDLVAGGCLGERPLTTHCGRFPHDKDGPQSTNAVVEPCRQAGRAGRHPRLPMISYGSTILTGPQMAKTRRLFRREEVIE